MEIGGEGAFLVLREQMALWNTSCARPGIRRRTRTTYNIMLYTYTREDCNMCCTKRTFDVFKHIVLQSYALWVTVKNVRFYNTRWWITLFYLPITRDVCDVCAKVRGGKASITHTRGCVWEYVFELYYSYYKHEIGMYFKY